MLEKILRFVGKTRLMQAIFEPNSSISDNLRAIKTRILIIDSCRTYYYVYNTRFCWLLTFRCNWLHQIGPKDFCKVNKKECEKHHLTAFHSPNREFWAQSKLICCISMKRIKNAWNDANGWIKAIKLISGISFSAIFFIHFCSIFALFRYLNHR